MIEGIRLTLEEGGWVTYGLVFVSIFLWTSIWLRSQVLRRGLDGDIEKLIARCLRQEKLSGEGVLRDFLDRAVGHFKAGEPKRISLLARRTLRRLAFLRSIVYVLVAVAPLLGLLGTVAGMVEMFSSLHGGARYLTKEATVAGGISKALVTTQLGLLIGAPGLIAARLLVRREIHLRRDVRQAVALLSAPEALSTERELS